MATERSRRSAPPSRSPEPRSGARRGRGEGGGETRGLFATWLTHHRSACRDAVAALGRDRLGSILVLLVLAVALALPGLLWVTVAELDRVGAGWSGTPRINVFMDPRARTRATEWAQRADVAAVAWQSPADALAELTAATGFDPALADELEVLGGNPLPAVALVTPAEIGPAGVRRLADQLGGEAGVQAVQVDLEWVARLQAALAVGERLVWGLGLLLGGAVLLVVGSLVRTAVEQRREEILVLRLVGAGDAFVRRPFLYLGAAQGLGAGVLAWGLVLAVVAALAGPVAELARSYGSAFRLDPPGVRLALVLAGAGMASGWLGAQVAARRRLATMEP